jgi:hypothetical protein
MSPDSERYVEIDNRFARCSFKGGGGEIFSGVQVTFSIFGITRHTTVYPPYTIAIDHVGSCPINNVSG